jgi:hypothetical protein
VFADKRPLAAVVQRRRLCQWAAMRIEGDYGRDGYALVKEIIPREVARAFMAQLRQDLPPGPLKVPAGEPIEVLRRPAIDIAGAHYRPMEFFLWALTPVMEQVTGLPLVPTYDYFRIYREGDVCLVHRDRPACEHSLSLTLDYSDDVPWPLELGKERTDVLEQSVTDDFTGEAMTALAMRIGDAVAYQGAVHRHGRTTPNPNGWSAHLFMHWVERGGPHAGQAFDGAGLPPAANFTFA